MKDPSYHPEFEVVIQGKQWTDTDTRTLQEFAETMNAFGGWFEQMMNRPKGKGIMFYATKEGGTLYHVRNGSATHSIVDPANIVMVFDSKAKGPFPKGFMRAKTNTATKIIEATEGARNVYDALDRLAELYGSGQKAVEAINSLANGSGHGKREEILDDTAIWDFPYPARGYNVRHKYSKSNPDSILIDTIREN